MMNGIIKAENTFCVKDFNECTVVSVIGQLSDLRFNSYREAVEGCRQYYDESLYQYLTQAENIENPDGDTWENMVFAGDPRGVYDGEKEIYRDVTSMDKGAATEEEIDLIGALCSTYKSLMAMIENK